MSAPIEQSSLKEFFAAYFHEDWADDAKNSDEVVADYLGTASAAEARALADKIIELARSGRSDAELEHMLFWQLGCYYMPSGTGQSAKAWLEQLATLLRDARRTLAH
jgi:hypothetical protein